MITMEHIGQKISVRSSIDLTAKSTSYSKGKAINSIEIIPRIRPIMYTSKLLLSI